MKSDTESETPSFGSFQDFQDATESDRQDDKLNLSTMTIIETGNLLFLSSVLLLWITNLNIKIQNLQMSLL